MKFQYTCILLAVNLVFIGCRSGPTEKSALNTRTSDTDSTFNLCYASFVKKDTVLLKALMFGDSIKGSLGYKLYEKNQRNGILLAKMYGDTVRGVYTFMSGDSEFVNEVAFLRQGAFLTEGLGRRIFKNGSFVFDSSQTVRFSGMKLVEDNCK